MTEFYTPRLSHIHHHGFTELARKAAQFIIDNASALGISEGKVYDLGSGSGVLASILEEQGFHVTGYDQSASMVEIAKEVSPSSTFIHASFIDADFTDPVMIVSTGECLNYLFDERNSTQMLFNLFNKIYQSLKTGGLFIFDMLGPYSGSPFVEHKLVEDENWTMFLSKWENEDKTRFYRDMIIFEKQDSGSYTRMRETHELQFIPQKEVQKALEEIGFEVQVHQSYPETTLPEGHRVYVCIKN